MAEHPADASRDRDAVEVGYTAGWVRSGCVHTLCPAGRFDWTRRDARELRDVLNMLDLDDPAGIVSLAADAAMERIETLTAALERVADVHHRTLTNSRLHNPEQIDSFRSCPCRTCDAATEALDA